MKMPISSLECCKKKNCMEKFSNLCTARNSYVFALYYTLTNNNQHKNSFKNNKVLTKNENDTKSKQKNKQTFKIS